MGKPGAPDGGGGQYPAGLITPDERMSPERGWGEGVRNPEDGGSNPPPATNLVLL